ncbi:DUF1254 domain-containing protein [Microbulbifer sp. JMSA003]|uniref:DUF1254 domain-containing protein n=1 Tax=Microbulbifer sp. JMSA003 TaxID=3243369 RepID=UPI00403966BD
MNKFTGVLVVAVFLGAIIGWYSFKILKQGANAYLFAYPLVVMEATRQSMAVDFVSGRESNHLYHMHSFPDHTFRNVVRPNNDTLYSVVWFDLTDGPMVISVPAMERYYILPFMDAWTNVFGSIGTSSNNGESGEYLLVGPEWSGSVPDDLEVIRSPTLMVWMIGRIEIYSYEDVANVATIQEGFAITPLSRWPDGESFPSTVISESRINQHDNPKAFVDKLSVDEFFQQFVSLLRKQAIVPKDPLALKNLMRFDLLTKNDFSLDRLPWWRRVALTMGSNIANQRLHEATESRRQDNLENGWRVWRDTIGEYGTNYATRAGVAMAGLGALKPDEAVYPTTYVDSRGEFLDGENSYRLVFPSAPPGNAFWSLTLYDVDGYLVNNPINRYLLSSRDPLIVGPDGALSILIANKAPKGNITNWLPSPKGEFSLTLRIYNPSDTFLNGKWIMPGVEKLHHY